MKSANVSNLRLVATITACFGAVILLACFLRSCRLTPSHRSFSGPIEDGNNASGVHGRYKRTIDFSPDGKFLAYIWSDAESVRSRELGARPRTLTESMRLRVRRLDRDGPELDVPLDSVDLRPGGITYFGLGVGVQAGPDSAHLMAIVARRIVIVDALSGERQVIEYAGEYFGSAAWLTSEEVAFTTTDGKALTFWRYNIHSPPAERVRIYTEPSQETVTGGLPPDLRHDQWSPNGRFVAFTSFQNTQQGESVLLDMRTQAIRVFPFSLHYQCWKPDSTALLVNDKFAEGRPFYLVNPATGAAESMTEQFAKEFGRNRDVTLVSPLWAPDGESVVLYTDEGSTARHRGCVVRLVPFGVVLSKNQILRWSPVTNWFLLQGEMTFMWIDISGQRTAPIEGWINDWTWSRDGALAARIEGGAVKVFRPSLPPVGK